MHQIKCEFAIITNDTDISFVSKKLNIKPTRYFNKGDEVFSKFSNGKIFNSYGLWAHNSPIIKSEEIDLKFHFDYFRKILEPKLDIIKMFKTEYGFETIFSIDIKTEFNTGIDIYEEDLEFISKIASRFSFSTFEVENIENTDNSSVHPLAKSG